MTSSGPQGGQQGCQGVRVGLIPAVLSQPLFGTTPEVVLLAAFQAFLVRTNNQEIISVGLQPSTDFQTLLPSAAAALDERDMLIVPCPAIDGASTLATHAMAFHQAALTSSAQSISPFQAVVASDVETAHAGAAASVLGLALLVHIGSNGSSQDAELVFKAGSRSQEDAKLMACHLQVFLSKLSLVESVTDSWLPLLRVLLMDHDEKSLVLEGFNSTHVPYDPATLVHGMFSENARHQPGAPCLIFEGCVYSYAEVDAAANRIANYLRNQAGAVTGDMIGVLVLRSPLMVAALLGVLRAGCGYLPLDHHHPEARIDFMVEDAAVKTVITQQDLLHKLPSSRGLHILLVQPDKVASAQSAALPSATISPELLGPAGSESPDWQLGQLGEPDTPCYIIYTSGSTGKPKGVVVLHKGLTAYTAWFLSHFSITSRDVFIQKTPTNFDASVDELWTSLSAGATLVVAPPEAHRDVHSVMTLITRYGVTTASAVPSQVQALAREILSMHSPADAAADRAPCASLKRVLSGGEALTTTMAREVAAALPACELHNTYGPTETTVGITSWLYTPPATEIGTDTTTCAAATIPIGRGIHNSRLYVLDPYLQPVPVGVPGQLFISGVQVAAGYLNRPDLTNEVFVANPFCEGPDTHTGRMYRTGDLVRWLPGQHACIEFLGRVDHQVKLRGFRIELQEVEAALGALQGVRQVVTAVVKNPATEQDHLVAWLSPKDLQPHSLVQQLQGSLPEYMRPTVVVLMDQLPLLVSEKVDRKALPAPNFATDMISAVTAPAATAAGDVSTESSSGSSLASHSNQEPDPLSMFVSAVWGEVLGLSATAALSHNEDFFSLGGNSLLAGKMNSTLRAGLHLPGMSGMLVYQHPSLAAFKAELAHLDPEVPSLSESGMVPDSSSIDGSSYRSYSPALRNASFSSLGTASSMHNSFSSQHSYSQCSAFHTSQSSPSIVVKPDKMTATPFAAFQSSPDLPQLSTIFSDRDADSITAAGLFKQLSRSLSKATDKQGADLDVLPIASVPVTAASPGRGDSLSKKLSRALSSESLSLRTMLNQPAAASSIDQLPISNTPVSDSTDRPVPFSFDAQKSDQQHNSSSRTPSRTNSITSKGALQKEDISDRQLQPAPAVKPCLVLATVMQLFSMCVISGVSSMLSLAPMLISMYILLAAGWRALVLLPAFELGSWLLLALWSVGGKWLLVGRYKQSEVPLWGGYYIRHWVAHLFVLSARQSFVPLVRRTHLLNWFYRALGVKVGRNVVIDTDDLLGYDLIKLQDDCILDAASGVSAITYEAGKPGDKFPLGTMRLEPVCVGERSVVGPNAMVTPGRVAPDSVVLPCSATSNPPALWRGSSRPTYGPEGRAAVNTQDPALGIFAGLAAMWITSFLITLLAYPVVVGYWTFFQWLVGPLAADAFSAAAATESAAWESLHGVYKFLSCWVQTKSGTEEAGGTCSYLMRATMLAMLVLPAVVFVSGQLLIVMVVPFKWLLRTHVQPLGTTPAAPKSWWQRFRLHLQQCLLDHPTVKAAAYLWTGTAIFNAWLRALGTKVGKQAWIGECLHLKHHELVEIGDTVSMCSAVTLLPSAALGAAKIRIMGGADVTNQTALYPGVTVKPGAVLGVFTYAEAGRTFPRHSITQGPMVLSPGQPDPVTPSPKPSPSKPPKAPTGSSTTPANTAQLATNITPSPKPSPSAAPGSSTVSTPYATPASSPAKASPTAAVYKTASPAATGEPEPSEARLVSWQKYFCFNMLYITLMSVLMPVHTVMLSAPSAVITVLLIFKLNWWAALLLAPAVTGMQTMVTICWMALLKRILLPRCHGSHPFYTYSHTAWMIEGLLLYYQQVSLVRYISGSQLAVWYNRALGERGVLLNGLHSQEPDCLSIGNDTVIDEMTFIMAHTVENRCLKFHDVVIGSNVTIGCGSCVLPGCYIGDGATMGDVSLLMKGETMPPGSVWKGVPALPCISGTTARRMRPPTF